MNKPPKYDQEKHNTKSIKKEKQKKKGRLKYQKSTPRLTLKLTPKEIEYSIDTILLLFITDDLIGMVSKSINLYRYMSVMDRSLFSQVSLSHLFMSSLNLLISEIIIFTPL